MDTLKKKSRIFKISETFGNRHLKKLNSKFLKFWKWTLKKKINLEFSKFWKLLGIDT